MVDALYYIACFIAMGLGLWWMKTLKRRQATRAQPARAAEAAPLGWTFEADSSVMFTIERWRGCTAGLNWTLETLRGGGSTEDGTRRSVARLTRWHAELALPVRGAACLLREFESDAAEPLDEKDFAALGGFFGNLAKQAIGKVHALAFDVMFGPLGTGIADIHALKPVDTITPDRPDDRLIAGHAADAPRLEAALMAMGRTLDAAPLRHTSRLPSLLLQPQGIALCVKERLREMSDLSRLVDAGVAAARAAASK